MHKSHLRQRHGSDAIRLERPSPSDTREPSPYSNTPSDGEDAIATPTHDALENNFRPPVRTSSLHTRSRATTNPQSSSAYRPSQPPSEYQSTNLSPYDPRQKLPDGASSPSLEATNAINGNPIVTYPPPPPTWTNMPNKPQLAILTLSRFVDFFQMASLQTYMVHQLKSFDPSLPDSAISHQAGVLLGSFTAAQIITSILWGRAADQPGVGRKLVLNIGLVGTGLGCIGVGFSRNYHQAVAWRVLSGAINGTVGSARTMLAETVDKRWHPRAFLLLPAAFNVANVAGPILGGMLVDPVGSYPHLFGPDSTFGGPNGVQWMARYPYALANLLSTALLFMEAGLVTMCLDETLKGFRKVEISVFDPVRLLRAIVNRVTEVRSKGTRIFNENTMLRRGLLSGREDASVELDRVGLDLDDKLEAASEKGIGMRGPQVLPFSRIWTSNVLWTLLSVAIFDFHMGAFSNLWILTLSTSRAFVPEDQQRMVKRSAFKFSGGLAFPPPTIGFAMAIIGFIGVTLQFLLYPYMNGKYGLMRCFRFSLFLFPLAYMLAPYITLLPSSSPSPHPASGFWVWLGISAVLTLQVAARTFALPASIILVNNSSPHPSVLATIHGLGQADSATFRTLGPILSGWWYGTWVERGVIGMAWWFVAAISACGCVASFYVRNGSGHEILLPGEEKDEPQGQGGGASSGR